MAPGASPALSKATALFARCKAILRSRFLLFSEVSAIFFTPGRCEQVSQVCGLDDATSWPSLYDSHVWTQLEVRCGTSPSILSRGSRVVRAGPFIGLPAIPYLQQGTDSSFETHFLTLNLQATPSCCCIQTVAAC